MTKILSYKTKIWFERIDKNSDFAPAELDQVRVLMRDGFNNGVRGPCPHIVALRFVFTHKLYELLGCLGWKISQCIGVLFWNNHEMICNCLAVPKGIWKFVVYQPKKRTLFKNTLTVVINRTKDTIEFFGFCPTKIAPVRYLRFTTSGRSHG